MLRHDWTEKRILHDFCAFPLKNILLGYRDSSGVKSLLFKNSDNLKFKNSMKVLMFNFLVLMLILYGYTEHFLRYNNQIITVHSKIPSAQET